MNIEIPQGMTNAAMLALVVGFVSPLVLNLIISAVWRQWVKSVAAFAWSVVVGSLTAWVAGAFTGLGLLSTILLVLVVSITTYQNFWKNVLPTMQRGTAAKAEQDAALVVAEQNRVANVAAAKVVDSGFIEKAVAADLAKPETDTRGISPLDG